MRLKDVLEMLGYDTVDGRWMDWKDFESIDFSIEWDDVDGGSISLRTKLNGGGTLNFRGPIHPNVYCEGQEICRWCGSVMDYGE